MITATGENRSTGDPAAVFPWWSFTKTVLAICALRLAATGHLTLDVPLAGHPFTLLQVLQHRAGLSDYGAVPGYHAAVAAGGPAWSRDRMIAEARAIHPDRPPGAGFSYSNIGYRMVRETVEQASGRDLARLVQDQITGPLGLMSVSLAQQTADMARQNWAAGHHYDPNWVLHGLLLGTARDAAVLLHALMAGNLLPPDLQALMLDIQPIGGAVPGRIWQTHGYGLGLMAGSVGNAGRAIGHSGGGPFSTNACYHFPDLTAPCTVVCFSNATDEAVPEHAALALAYPSANSRV